MRGKVAEKTGIHQADRITPAYAGKRDTIALLAAAIRDHPRVCGEKLPMQGNAEIKPGSPPRMRGKETGEFHNGKEKGITPAYAGKSSPYSPAQK